MRAPWLFALGLVLGYVALFAYSLANPGTPPPDWRPDYPEPRYQSAIVKIVRRGYWSCEIRVERVARFFCKIPVLAIAILF